MTLPFRRAILAASLFALAAPAHALADVTIERDGSSIYVSTPPANGGSGEVSMRTDGDGNLLVYTESFGAVTGLGGCVPYYTDEWDCGNGDVSSIDIDLSSTDESWISLDQGIAPDNAAVTVKGGSSEAIFTADRAATYGVDFTGGAGKDFGNFGAGNDTFNGGGGDDVMRPSPGDDTFYGGAGNDTLETGTEADGADTFIGGTDPGTYTESRYRGDAVTYSERTTPINATIANTGAEPSADGGAPSEGDRFSEVETVEGGSGVNTLHGNDADNDLFGGPAGDTLTGGDGDDDLYPGAGADSVSGDGGDDEIEARRDIYEAGTDIDAALSCGTGTDRIRRDQNDPATTDCEQDVPGFVTNTSVIAGNLNVGSTLTVAGLDVFAGPGTTSTTFFSCADADYNDCREMPEGASYVLKADDLGRRIFAASYVQDSSGYGDRSETALSAAVGAALPAPAPAPAPIAIAITPPSFTDSATGAATAALGAGAKIISTLKLGDAVNAFTPKSVVKSTLPIGSKPAPVLAVVCKGACVVQSKLVVTLPKVGKKKAKTIKLPSQKKTVKAGEAAVVSVKTNSAQRKAIKASKGAKVAVSVSVTQGGKTTKGKSTFKLKVTKP